MRKRTAIAAVLLVGFAPAVGQKTFTVPAKGIHSHTIGSGLGYIVPAKNDLPSRQQCLYATTDLPGSPILIREVAFQTFSRNRWIPPLEAVIVSLTLDMSIGPRAPRKWSNTFSQNLGKAVSRVFSGKIQLPKVTSTTRQGWLFRLPLQKPFLANRKIGPSLVLDFSTTSVISKMSTQWPLIQGRQDTGTTKFQGFGYSCHFTKIRTLFQSFPGGMYVGSKWSWLAAPLLANQPGFLTIGDAGWGSKWGGLTLPIDFKPFGAPGCLWEVRPLLSFPFLVDWQGRGNVVGLQIPNDSRLANVKFYVQGAYAYPKANALGWLFLPSLEFRIGTGEDHNGAVVGVSNNSPPGTWGQGLVGDPVPYCRLTYK